MGTLKSLIRQFIEREGMAIGWFSVLQAVPWGQVIDNAPKVVDGAKKFWNAVARKHDDEPQEVADVTYFPADQSEALSLMSQRLAVLEKSTDELHRQMVESSALISTLADQNVQLIARIESNRKRMFWLTLVCAVLSGVVLIGAVLMYG
jgi:hypothetical protein